jgi:amino acid transporter
MAQLSQPGGRSNVSVALAEDRLGLPPVLFFIMSAAAPLTVIIGVIPTAYAITGVRGIPAAFIAIGIVLAIFAVGYVAMARHISNAGAFYAYITRGLGRPAGVGASLVALVAYNALQVGLYGAFGFFLSGALHDGTFFNVTANVAWYWIALAAWGLVAILGVLRIDLSGIILAILLVAEVIVAGVLAVSDIIHPAGNHLTFDTLAPTELVKSGIGAGFVIAVLGFVGFESAAVFSEEAKRPRRTIPLATFFGIFLIALLYATSSWGMSVATGSDKIIDESVKSLDPANPPLVVGLAGAQLGDTMVKITLGLLITSLLAALISFHNTVARYTFALGRERVLPAFLGRTGRRSGSPQAASVLQSIVGLAVIITYWATGADPLVKLFFYVGTFGGFGILVLLAITSIAVIGFFARDSHGESPVTWLVTPILAVLLLAGVGALAVINFGTLLGVQPGTPDAKLAWILPSIYAVVAVFGFLVALVIKLANPDVYATIGLGATSVTGRTSAVAFPEPARANW